MNILFDVTIFLLVPVISHSDYLSWMFPLYCWTAMRHSFLRRRLINLGQRELISYCLTVPRTLVGLISLVTFCGTTTWLASSRTLREERDILGGSSLEPEEDKRKVPGNDHMLWESSSWLICWSIWTRRQCTELVHRRLLFQQDNYVKLIKFNKTEYTSQVLVLKVPTIFIPTDME